MMLFAAACFGRSADPTLCRSDAACHFPVSFEKRVVALEVRIFRTPSLKLLMELESSECLQQSYRRSRCILVSDRTTRGDVDGETTMKKFLLATVGLVALGMNAPASAADLAARPYTKAPPPGMADLYDWSGL